MTYSRVYQRNAALTITGFAAGGVTVEGNVGSGWQTIQANVDGAFSGTLIAPSAPSSLQVRIQALNAGSVIRPAIPFGDIFVIAGQSNAAGQLTNNQSYSHAALNARLFGNDYTWKDLSDPTDSNIGQVDAVSSDATVGGSVWPLLATQYMAALGVPCAFVPCAKTSTSITAWQPGANHQNRATLYGSMVYRALQAGGVKAVLWWQGETDAVNAMSTADYATNLQALGDAVFADLGVPIVACKFQHCVAGATLANQQAIWTATGNCWGTHHIIAGPDLSGIDSEDGGFHIKTDATALSVASLWWSALRAAFGW